MSTNTSPIFCPLNRSACSIAAFSVRPSYGARRVTALHEQRILRQEPVALSEFNAKPVHRAIPFPLSWRGEGKDQPLTYTKLSLGRATNRGPYSLTTAQGEVSRILSTNASLKSLLCRSNACLGFFGSFIRAISCVISRARFNVWVSTLPASLLYSGWSRFM